MDINNFFAFTEDGQGDISNIDGVTRVSYTREHAEYTAKYIKEMVDIGMQVTIDKVGNICGTFPGDYGIDKSLVLGSHTDSVKKGGQFDGALGVFMALDAVKQYKSQNVGKQYGNLKVVIFACEESTRFKKACLGSNYIGGKLPYKSKSGASNDLALLKDEDGMYFEDAVRQYRTFLSEELEKIGISRNILQNVDKVLTPDENIEAIEPHIEQSDFLSSFSEVTLGIITSIGKAVRVRINVDREKAAVINARLIVELNKLVANLDIKPEDEVLRITVPQFDSNISPQRVEVVELDDPISRLLNVEFLGENNHSGATAMTDRKDATLGMAKTIESLNDLCNANQNLKIEFLGSVTPVWGANQVQNYARTVLKVSPISFLGQVEEICRKCAKESKVEIECEEIDAIAISSNENSEIYVDVRQQYPITAEESLNKLESIIQSIQDEFSLSSEAIQYSIIEQGDPVQTTPELIDEAIEICKKLGIPCKRLGSWPGHDIACFLSGKSTGKRLLIFVPSEGGSHNPNETTSKNAINVGRDLVRKLVSNRMKKNEKEYNEVGRDI